MKWSTIQLLKFRDKGLSLNETVDMSDIKKIDPQILDVSPISVKGRADISSQRVTFHLHIEGYLVLPCSRTLVDVKLPIDVNSTETFMLKANDYDQYENEEVHQIQGDIIDLKPVITELLLLEIPLQVLSDEAREKEQLPSGNNWEVLTEDQALKLKLAEDKEEKVDPRLAKLSQLLDQNKNT